MNTEDITLQDGTKLIPLEKEILEKVNKEIAEVMDKYECTYVPALVKVNSLSEQVTSAQIHIYKVIKPEEENGGEKGKEAQA
jgi:hypothetical protein